MTQQQSVGESAPCSPLFVEKSEAFPSIAHFHETSKSDLLPSPRHLAAGETSRHCVHSAVDGLGGRRRKMSLVDNVAETLQSTMLFSSHASLSSAAFPVPSHNTHNPKQTLVIPSQQAAEGGMTKELSLQALKKGFSSLKLNDSILFSCELLTDPKKMESMRKIVEVRQRAMNQRTEQIEEKQRMLKEQEEKVKAATARRAFLEDQRKIQRACTWWAVYTLVNATANLGELIVNRRLVEQTRRLLLPIVLVAMRRSLRRARQRLYGKGITKPTVTQLKTDKILALYSDAHIESMIRHLTLRYYFQNETIIFMGCEEDEAYYLHSGTADVMMGQTKVFTIRSGMTFGTVGMISGEPRSATIIAKEPTFVWVVNRDDFESGGRGDQQVAAAMASINELRQKNIRTVYKAMLEPSHLSKFLTFKGVSNDVLNSVMTVGVPRILKAGEELVTAFSALSSSQLYYILRGKIRITMPLSSHQQPDDSKDGGGKLTPQSVALSPQATATITSERELAEHLAVLCDPLVRSAPGLTESIFVTAAGQYWASKANFSIVFNKKGEEVVAEFTGPLLLNFSSSLTGEHSPFSVETASVCDAIALTSYQILRQDVLELAVLRQNCHNLRVEFIPKLRPTEIIRVLFAGSLSFGFLSSLRRCAIPFTPWVIAPNQTITFSPNDPEVLIVLKGELVPDDTAVPGSSSGGEKAGDHPVVYPYMWPEMQIVYFGSQVVQSRTKTRVDALAMHRGDILAWLVNEASEVNLNTLAATMTELYVSRTGRRPAWADVGSAPSAGSRPSRLRSFKAMAMKAISLHAAKPLHEAVRRESIAPPVFGDRRKSNYGDDMDGGGTKTTLSRHASAVSDGLDRLSQHDLQPQSQQQPSGEAAQHRPHPPTTGQPNTSVFLQREKEKFHEHLQELKTVRAKMSSPSHNRGRPLFPDLPSVANEEHGKLDPLPAAARGVGVRSRSTEQDPGTPPRRVEQLITQMHHIERGEHEHGTHATYWQYREHEFVTLPGSSTHPSSPRSDHHRAISSTTKEELPSHRAGRNQPPRHQSASLHNASRPATTSITNGAQKIMDRLSNARANQVSDTLRCRPSTGSVRPPTTTEDEVLRARRDIKNILNAYQSRRAPKTSK